jgi:hypothetical protein
MFKGDSEEIIPLTGTAKLVLIIGIILTIAMGICPDMIKGGW